MTWVTDGLTAQEKIDRGAEARRLLESPVLADAIDSAREAAVARFLKGDKPDPDAAVAAWATDKALNLVKDALRRALSEGEFEAEVAARPRS